MLLTNGFVLYWMKRRNVSNIQKRFFVHSGFTFLAWVMGKVSYMPMCIRQIAVPSNDSPLAVRVRKSSLVAKVDGNDGGGSSSS